MAQLAGSVTEPIPISKIGGRYLLFDINVVTYLRRAHNICGVLIGSIPQVPQQNVFLGLPVELLPEEVKLLVEKEVAYLVDDSTWHKQKFSTFKGAERTKYLESLRSEGRKAKSFAERESQKKSERGLAKQAMLRASKETIPPPTDRSSETYIGKKVIDVDSASVLFDSSRPSSPAPSLKLDPSKSESSITSLTITPTITYDPSSLPQNALSEPEPAVPVSYPLFAHLHAHDYFITPGLRFGCDYTVYPGDPLRFHSHFLAVGYDWTEEIPLLDLIGGGRLGTGVKKGFLIGGVGRSKTSRETEAQVRTFCIEWGGM